VQWDVPSCGGYRLNKIDKKLTKIKEAHFAYRELCGIAVCINKCVEDRVPSPPLREYLEQLASKDREVKTEMDSYRRVLKTVRIIITKKPIARSAC